MVIREKAGFTTGTRPIENEYLKEEGVDRGSPAAAFYPQEESVAHRRAVHSVVPCGITGMALASDE